jgi:methyl-accepting chemotaxis protein
MPKETHMDSVELAAHRATQRPDGQKNATWNSLRWWQGLSFRFSLFVGVALILATTVSAYIGATLERRSLVKGLENQVTRLTDLLSANVATPLFTFNQENLNAVAHAFSRDTAIRLLEIKDKSGKVVAQAERESKDLQGVVVITRAVKVGSETVGSVNLGVSTESVDEAMRSAWRVLLFREAASLVLLFSVLTFLVRRQVARPLKRLNDLFMKAQTTGDLTVRSDLQRRDEVGMIARRFDRFMETLQGLLAQVSDAASQVASASQQLSSASEELSSGSQEQASSLEETAASLEEITGTVKQNADNAKQANQLAMGSRETAETGGQVVTSAVEAMGKINVASKRIADIITTIDEIAFQTNLLALNAAVEAARAGEQGRGFAVVAAEVRNLAQRSATAAKEIKGLIQDSVHKVEGGSELVNKSGQTLQEIVNSVKRVTDIIGEIAAASQEQSTGIDQVNRAVTQMEAVVQSNGAQTEELSSTAQSLAAQAEQLQALVAKFKLGERQGQGGTAPRVEPALRATVVGREIYPPDDHPARFAAASRGRGPAQGANGALEEF